MYSLIVFLFFHKKKYHFIRSSWCIFFNDIETAAILENMQRKSSHGCLKMINIERHSTNHEISECWEK